MFGPLEKLVTKHSFLPAIRAALELDEAGIDSPHSSPIPSPTSLPSSPLTPIVSDDSMDVSRLSIMLPSPSPPSSPVALPPTSSPVSLSSSSPPASPVSLPPALSESEWSESSDCSVSDIESEYGGGESEYDDPSIDAAPASNKKKRKRKRKVNPGDGAAKKARLQAKHQVEAEMRGPTGLRSSTFRELPLPLITELASLAEMQVTSTGFTGKRLLSLKEKHLWKLDEVERDDMEVVHWDGWYLFCFLFLSHTDTHHLLVPP